MNFLKVIIKQLTLNRIFFILIVILALAAGFFHSAWQTEQKKYALLEKNYQTLTNNCQARN